MLKNLVPSYRENFQHAQKIWIEFGRPSPKFGQKQEEDSNIKGFSKIISAQNQC
jgi:hypothetical protein